MVKPSSYLIRHVCVLGWKLQEHYWMIAFSFPPVLPHSTLSSDSSLFGSGWFRSLAYQYTTRGPFGWRKPLPRRREEKSQSVPINTDVCRKWLQEFMAWRDLFFPVLFLSSQPFLSLFFWQIFFFSFWVPVPQPLVIGIWKKKERKGVQIETMVAVSTPVS